MMSPDVVNTELSDDPNDINERDDVSNKSFASASDEDDFQLPSTIPDSKAVGDLDAHLKDVVDSIRHASLIPASANPESLPLTAPNFRPEISPNSKDGFGAFESSSTGETFETDWCSFADPNSVNEDEFGDFSGSAPEETQRASYLSGFLDKLEPALERAFALENVRAFSTDSALNTNMSNTIFQDNLLWKNLLSSFSHSKRFHWQKSLTKDLFTRAIDHRNLSQLQLLPRPLNGNSSPQPAGPSPRTVPPSAALNGHSPKKLSKCLTPQKAVILDPSVLKALEELPDLSFMRKRTLESP